MQSFLFLVVAVVSHEAMLSHARTPDWIPPDMMSMVKDDKERCMSEHGTDEAMIQRASEGDLIDDRKLKCYMYCLLESFSLVNTDGDFERELMLGFLPENLQDIAQDTLDACANVDGDDPCDRTYMHAVCIYKRAPQLWFMV